MGMEGIDTTLDSFIDPEMFFQAAVLSLRNTLIGQTPSTLGEILALYCLSHTVQVSCHLRSSHNPPIINTQAHIDQWGSAISRYDHRQVFVNLIEALHPEIQNLSPAPHFLDPMMPEYSGYLHFIYQDVPFELPPDQNDGLMGYLSEYADATPDLFALSEPPPTDQAALNDRYTFSGETQLTGPRTSALLGPRGSALVTNLTLFLEQCGDLFQTLAGRWVTAKHQYSPSSALNQARSQGNDVKTYLQRMRQDGSFQDPSSMGILSIVDTFIQLGYLQTPEDVQDYMIIVGKVQRRKIEDNYSATDTSHRKLCPTEYM
ncbi:hypothetical protein NW756_009629 [Fusarium oxysporum]|nr:hypothetical protein NW763_012730 [Fusarium oxysporum]KAJ4045165.1 hypothetical protein NW753_009809 [Fusarium oxysporum]KAJ4083428.1 hypothetical protein NW756_009629 [Fusarium oxysporum]